MRRVALPAILDLPALLVPSGPLDLTDGQPSSQALAQTVELSPELAVLVGQLLLLCTPPVRTMWQLSQACLQQRKSSVRAHACARAFACVHVL